MHFRSALSLVAASVALAAAAATATAEASSAPAPARATAPRCVGVACTIVVGKTVTEAQKARVAEGYFTYGVSITDEVVNTNVPPETVLSATRNRLTIALPANKPCAVGQLALTLGAENGAGERNVRAVFVRNVSTHWCTLRAPMTLVGLGATGHPDTNTLTITALDPTLDVLSPNAPPLSGKAHCTGTWSCGFYPKDVLFAAIAFTGTDVCSLFPLGTPTSIYVTPSAWLVTFPGTIVLTTPNRSVLDPHDRGFSSCGGGIGDTVEGPQTISAH